MFLLFIPGSNLGGGGPVRGFRGEEEGGSVRSGPGAARTILLFHIISARPSKQPRMVGIILGVYSFGLIFVSARTNKRHHHHSQYQHSQVGSTSRGLVVRTLFPKREEPGKTGERPLC
jgi:hypothetical protein